MKLNPNEQHILIYLAECALHNPDYSFRSFASIDYDTLLLDRKSTRRACRSLKRKGLAQFANGLSDEDGNFRGSRYAATDYGIQQAYSISKTLKRV